MRDASRALRWTLSFLLLQALTVAVTSAGTVYVNKNASGATRDGASWASAFHSVQEGLNAAVSGDEVWVAASAPASAAYVERITLVNGVALYGGFDGTETARSDRDAKANVTILDGGKGGSVVSVPVSIAVTATIDGFTIRNGYATSGAGVVVLGKSVIVNNVITGNQATGDGGGIRAWGGVVSITNNVISGNSAVNGGGIHVDGSNYTITNNLIANNSATNYGGGINTRARLTASGNTIAGNTAPYGGGLAYYSGFTVTVSNTIVAFNSSGIFRDYGTLDIRNSDVFSNTAYNYSGLTDPTGTKGNISQDPVFVDRPGGNFRLQAGSPCVDTGDDAAVVSGETDLDGKPRIVGSHVDMGSYEYGSVGPPPFTFADVSKCLSIGCGTQPGTADDLSRLNVESGGNTALDLCDAARLARKAAGLETNP